jgi:hypothetical protein
LAAFDAREYGVARHSFFELAQARPRAPDAWYNFAVSAWQVHDTAAAVVGWQRAMRLDPMASDVRAHVRLAPGAPRLWHAVPPVTLTLLAAIGGALWVIGFLLLAWSRRRARQFTPRVGVALVAGAGIVWLGGLKQRDILAGKDAAVVLSSARLRAMPVLSSDEGIEAQPGEVARILAQQGAWTKVELTDRRQGWVEGQRLQLLSQDAPVWSISR